MKRTLFLFVALLTALIIGGCGTGGNPTLNDLTSPDSLYEDKRVLLKLIDEFKNISELKGKDLQVFQTISIDEQKHNDRYVQNIQITILKPGTEKEVVEYEYSTGKEKKWTGPHPIKVVGGGDIKPNLFAFNDINFDIVPAMCKQTREKTAALKDVEIVIIMLKLDDEDLHPFWTVKFSHTKGDSNIRGSVDFDLQGNLIVYDPGDQN